MKFSVSDRILEFRPVLLKFDANARTDAFAHKNNKSVAETLVLPKYSHLMELVVAGHSDRMESKLGTFLSELKAVGDPLYKRFLNSYGDDVYCNFSIPDSAESRLMGLYCFVVESRLKYIGKSVDSFRKRINQG
jgi:hypothetical protein